MCINPGYNVEYENVSFTVWHVGGKDKVRTTFFTKFKELFINLFDNRQAFSFCFLKKEKSKDPTVGMGYTDSAISIIKPKPV